MWFNRAALKAEAKACMRQSTANPYITALVYTLISFILAELSSRLLFPSDLVYFSVDTQNYTVHFEVSPYYFERIYREPLAYLIDFLVGIADYMLDVGMIIFALNVARRAESAIGNLFDGFAQFLRVILLYLLEGLFVFLWALLFIIPGIVASYRYRLAIYLLLDHPEMGVMDCIRESKRLMYGRKGELFILDLSFLGWYLLTIIPFASVYVTPYIQTTRAGYYLAVISIDSQHDSRGRFGREDGRQDYREPWE